MSLQIKRAYQGSSPRTNVTRCIVKFEATKIKRRFYEQLEGAGERRQM